MDFTVNSSIDTLLKSTGFMMDDCDTLKSAYSLYNTAYLLKQANAASIELIEESVALFYSKIAEKTTMQAVNDPRQQIKNPSYLRTSQVIARADENGVWQNWAAVMDEMDKTGLF
jgi:hypothetical protein